MKTQQLNTKKMGFSLIELSIVILIIGILVLGITKGSLIISKAKLGSAKSLTNSSPVSLIPDLVAWYEPTLDNAFVPSSIVNDASLISWNDNSPTRDVIATLSRGTPKYNESAINGLPAVKFGVSDELKFNSLYLNNKHYTVFVVERRGTEADEATLVNIGEGAVLGYTTNTTIGDSASVAKSTVVGYSANSLVPRISTFLSDSSAKAVFINGSKSPMLGEAGLTNATTKGFIGSGLYAGDISEIIIYNRGLNASERNDIQAYLSKKYAINVSVSE
jgi:prepilin-type N-terminal cleavage/methylation domain-containing protein